MNIRVWDNLQEAMKVGEDEKYQRLEQMRGSQLREGGSDLCVK